MVAGGVDAFGAAGEEPWGAPGTTPQSRGLVVVLNIVSVLCFALWWWWMDRRPTGAIEGRSLALAVINPAAESEWKTRALAAEARAEKAAALLKARLMPQVARWMMGELMQRLLHQRSDLLTSQQKAEEEVADLEKRLEKLHAPLEDRLLAYERRIAELERDLAAKGEENRELIRAKIDTARKKLASERSKTPAVWN